MKKKSAQRGAAAVELALLMPILLMLLIGIIEFGRLWWAQGALSGAAREGARYYAIHIMDPGMTQALAVANTQTAVRNTALGLPAPGDGPLSISIAVSGTCPGTGNVTVTVGTNMHQLTGFFGFLGSTIPVSGKGVMRCGG